MSNSSTDSSDARRWLLCLCLTVLALVLVAETWLRLAAPRRDVTTAAVVAARQHDVQAAVLGDSHTFALGARMKGVQNLSIPGANLAIMASLADMLLSHAHPRLAILAVGPEMFAPSSLNRGDGGLSEGWTALPLYLAQAPLARRLAPSLLDRGGGAEGEMAALGVGQRWDQVPETRRALWTRARVQQQRPAANLAAHAHLALLRRTIGRFQAVGAIVCLVRTPVTELYLEEMMKFPELHAYEQTIAKLVAETGVRWVDSRTMDPPLELHEFLNQDHVNATGAARYAPWLQQRCVDKQ